VLLLVEDNADDIALARRALARSDVKAHLEVTGSGNEALAFLESAARLPRVVFVDLNMPGLSGFDLLRRLRHNPQTRTLPVVVLTTSTDPVDIGRCYTLGANSFITKPVDFSEFTDLFIRVSRYWMNDNQPPPA
jgi:two-component system, response regulator